MRKIIISLILILIIILLATSFLIFTFKSVFQPRKRAPYVWTFKRHFIIMKNIRIKPNANILDLWCWDWKALRFFNKYFKLKKITWYDINPYAIIRWKIINKITKNKNIELTHKNFLNTDIKWFDYIYIYLWTKQLAEIEDRIRKNKEKHTIIISNSFQFKKHKTLKTFKNKKWKNAIFLYK
jgi:hypothetical protein